MSNYLIKYKTEIGIYSIADDFSVWFGGSCIHSSVDSLEEAKKFVQEHYNGRVEEKINGLEERLEILKSAPNLVEDCRVSL